MNENRPEPNELSREIEEALLPDTLEKWGGGFAQLDRDTLEAYAVNLRVLREWQEQP